MGAEIDGAGTSTLTVDGVAGCAPPAPTRSADRIVGGTWAFAAVMTAR